MDLNALGMYEASNSCTQHKDQLNYKCHKNTVNKLRYSMNKFF